MLVKGASGSSEVTKKDMAKIKHYFTTTKACIVDIILGDTDSWEC